MRLRHEDVEFKFAIVLPARFCRRKYLYDAKVLLEESCSVRKAGGGKNPARKHHIEPECGE